MNKIELVKKALKMYEKANIVLTDEEKLNIEIADFGLNDMENTALTIVTYVNTERCCAKEMVLMPNQTCPEHRHPNGDLIPGKEETFRCRFGEVFLYVEGEPSKNPHTNPPKGVYTVFHEIVLKPGEQYTIYPDTLHWFKAGQEGAVISEFSTKSNDDTDIFSDVSIIR